MKVSFWKKLFGSKESPKAPIAERQSTQPSAPSNPPTDDQPASFFMAVERGDLEAVKALIKADPNLVFIKDKHGWTSLHLAAENGHEEVAKLLLASNAQLNALSDPGVTPLYSAASQGHKGVVILLLDNEAKVNEGKTPPLRSAVASGHEDVVELLLAKGADVNARDEEGETPLHWAAKHNFKVVAELLLANQAEVNAKDDIGYTPLHWAAAFGHMDMAELLRQHGGHE